MIIEMDTDEGGRESTAATKRIKFSKPGTIAVILGVGLLFVGALIAVIVVGTASSSHIKSPLSDSSYEEFSSLDSAGLFSSSAPKVSSSVPQPSSSSAEQSSSSDAPPQTEFYQYTAEIIHVYVGQRNMHKVFDFKTVMNVFGPGNYSVEYRDNEGIPYSRQFSKGNGERTLCEKVGDHNNCFTITGAPRMGFGVDPSALVFKGIPCSSICEKILPDVYSKIAAKRHLQLCDMYLGTDMFDYLYYTVAETGTNYPVLEVIKHFNSPHIDADAIVSFSPKKPTDESVLEPFDVTEVYDLRDGKGDSGPSISSKKENDGKFNNFFEQIRRDQMIHDRLHRPSSSHPIDRSLVRRSTRRDDQPIPPKFDAREHWSQCADIIGTVSYQGRCGCCWAMSSSAVLSDRLCIAKNVKELLSPQYMIYCGEHTMGCGGNMGVDNPWEQLLHSGTVSEDCIPFTERDGICPTKCRNGTKITDDMIFHSEGVVFPWGSTPETRVEAIQREIMANGPVSASFQVFSDFTPFTGGVYHRSKEAVIGGVHSVRIIGWGTTDDGEDYWLVVNSWGTDWCEDGLFKIRRGNNECNIEEQVAATVFY